MSKKQGVLLCNLGTPDAPTANAVRKYLRQFLRDKRVVSIPRVIWYPILHGIILRTRPQKVAKLYQSIWTEKGSPLFVYSQSQRSLLQSTLDAACDKHIPVELGMCYGNPSLPNALQALEAQGCERIVVLPLYPQYSSATNAAVFDQISLYYKKQFAIPELSYINGYHNNSLYINALSKSIKAHWKEFGQAQKLLFSYHGVPQRFSNKGDPYEAQCRETTRLVIAQLGLEEDQYLMAFQSRFGKEEWVKPYTNETLEQWAKEGVKSVQIISPAFSVDCLETLEELAVENRDLFLGAGGKDYSYIPALNDSPEQIELLFELVKQRLL